MKIKKTLKESVITAMDGCNIALYPFLPYIFQDQWELGTDPQTVITLLRKHSPNPSYLNILDLGCGKGAVSVKIAKKFRCRCLGIDAVKEFIYEAKNKATKHRVQKLCQFQTGDIREKIKSMKGFNAIILGSIGPILGDYLKTLRLIKKCITDDGVIIIADGYLQNETKHIHPLILRRKIILNQISAAGMKLIDEIIFKKDSIRKLNNKIFRKINKRCNELIKKHPSKSLIFYKYIKNQQEENIALEQEIICATMVLKKYH